MTATLTLAEELFGAIAPDVVVPGMTPMAIALPPEEPYVPGPRSALCPPDCPYDFPDQNASGGHLIQVMGPGMHPKFPQWSAHYSVVVPDVVLCWYCQKPIKAGAGRGDGSTDESTGYAYSARAFRDDPTRCVLQVAHALCATEASGRKVTSMSTHSHLTGLPDCLMCGEPYLSHASHVTSIWESYCDDEWNQAYRPAEPFHSRHWPHRVIVDSPRYTRDGKILYGDTEQEAIERLKAEAAMWAA